MVSVVYANLEITMSWYSKEQPTRLDAQTIEGLHFLDGDIFARLLTLKYRDATSPFFNPDWLKNQKFPQVEFPSGEIFDIWESSNPAYGGIIHIYGEMDLPYFDTRDRAWEQADDIAEQVGYLARKRGEDRLEVIGHDEDEHFIVTYDNDQCRMTDITRVPPKYVEAPRPPVSREPLLDEESRTRLPLLRTNEDQGLEAEAQVKFFDPYTNWTWYASEASAILRDGTHKSLAEIDPHDPQIETVIFFGLVNGFELEFGYFSLAELEELRETWQGQVERDLLFIPKTLQELQEQHLRERGAL